MNIQAIVEIIKKYDKTHKCYTNINPVNIYKKCKNIMKKFVSTIVLLINGWGIAKQLIINTFKNICPHIAEIMEIINKPNLQNKLLCSIYPFDDNDVVNLLILFINKDEFIGSFKQELDELINYENKLDQLKTICTEKNLLPSMVLIYCVRDYEYQICKTNYNNFINKYTDMLKLLMDKIDKLEELQKDFINKQEYTDINTKIANFKTSNSDYKQDYGKIIKLYNLLSEKYNISEKQKEHVTVNNIKTVFKRPDNTQEQKKY